ncbi:MAG TPA: RcpC/CpaB family pilus assembly protein [Abditibacteriaceae bacterium]
MRLNRNTRIGLALVGAALILLLFVRLFQGLTSPSAPPAPVAANPDTTAQPVLATNDGMSAVAIAEIPERSIITADMLQMRPIAQQFSDTDRELFITDPSQVIGFITNKRLIPGERLRRNNLVGHITEVGISGALRPGLRAMFVPIANKTTLHDMVKVGDFVDVIGSFDGQESRTIVQNVRVLAVDVFGKDFPQVKAAQRGDYKAEPRGVGFANPPSPNTGAPAPQASPQGAPAAGAAPTPTPTATPAPEGPPPAKPDPALTLEVTPDQATAIALAQNATATLDFILRPRPAIATVGEVRVVALTKPRLAPYADRIKRTGGNPPARSAQEVQVRENRRNVDRLATAIERSGGSGGGGGYSTPQIPDAMVPPANPGAPMGTGGAAVAAAPETYNIPIYGDGKMTRVDTVRKP